MVSDDLDRKLLDYFMNDESYTIVYDYLNFEIDDSVFELFENKITITNEYLNQFKNTLSDKNKDRFDIVCFHSAKNIFSLSHSEHVIIKDNNISSIFKLISFERVLELLEYFLGNERIALNMDRDNLLKILIEVICYNISPDINQIMELSNVLNKYDMTIPFIYNKIYTSKELSYIFKNIHVNNSFYFFQMFKYIDSQLGINKEFIKFLEINRLEIKESFYLTLFDFEIKYKSIVIQRNQNKEIIIKLYEKLLAILVKQKHIGTELEIKINVRLNKYSNKK